MTAILINRLLLLLLLHTHTHTHTHTKKDIRKIERIQKAATKITPSLSPTHEKRERGDFIVVQTASKGLENIDREDLFV